MTDNYHVTQEEKGQRIDKYLSDKRDDLSRAQIQTWIKEGYIQVNESQTKANYKVQVDDLITLTEKEPEVLDIQPENIPLDIVYQDKDVVVVNKPKGMVVHPSPGHPNGTLVNALMYHIDDLSGIHDVVRPGIVHRIDRDTSGLLMVAKNDHAHQSLAKQLKDKTVKRSYVALVHGDIPHEYGTIDAPIGRDTKDRQRMTVVTGGKDAITHFEVLERIGQQYTLVKCVLETGRTHQIRVHMRYIGFPLVGDPKYGHRKTLATEGQALHAQEIGFHHPTTNEWLAFEVDPPKIFTETLENLRQSY
ncbi:pseudouridine synthase [Halolactibacillus alkaliphilus]|uniref:Pseudouridine synthase n=1 Tax=Halolactibacillus alkaliphilus TaxID=442899 RepID=A0A511WX56_9BACI|nr:RluA family pseudouridine synthase [Halolactibacillus alkaliphilus]GEN55715.1 pseudouridine synthase [Halolactibacillus alkaliphilus]GGN65271.1 pseudouridine synthase [Halolactibacillus alkaliphilus]SFO64014.1 ribosomal large subunit pseudouridine synthase D [Halolactibacillus alkaliphilus]